MFLVETTPRCGIESVINQVSVIVKMYEQQVEEAITRLQSAPRLLRRLRSQAKQLAGGELLLEIKKHSYLRLGMEEFVRTVGRVPDTDSDEVVLHASIVCGLRRALLKTEDYLEAEEDSCAPWAMKLADELAAETRDSSKWGPIVQRVSKMAKGPQMRAMSFRSFRIVLLGYLATYALQQLDAQRELGATKGSAPAL